MLLYMKHCEGLPSVKFILFLSMFVKLSFCLFRGFIMNTVILWLPFLLNACCCYEIRLFYLHLKKYPKSFKEENENGKTGIRMEREHIQVILKIFISILQSFLSLSLSLSLSFQLSLILHMSS